MDGMWHVPHTRQQFNGGKSGLYTSENKGISWYIVEAFEKYGRNQIYKDFGIEW